MPFNDDVVRNAWRRAGGKCECRRKTHGHRYVRCGKQLVWGTVEELVEGPGRLIIKLLEEGMA